MNRINSLKDEFDFYKKHQAELVKKYHGRYVVIFEDKIIGDYDTQEEAVAEAVKTHDLGTFLVHLVGDGEENYTQTFHSRVAHARIPK